MRFAKIVRPPVGSKLWFAQEHLYYVPEYAAPRYEFVVYEGEVKEYIEGGYLEICLRYRKEERGPIELFYAKFTGLGDRIHDNPRDAALDAKRRTEEYEKCWGWTGDVPIRRTWERYLTEE